MAFDVVRTATVYRNMKDPNLLKYYYKFKALENLHSNEVSGSSPPDIFVGRFGYPNVFIGPMVPPQFGDTSIMSTPERWVGKTIPEIVEMRSMLVRGMYRTKVTMADNGRIEEMVKELAISDRYSGVTETLARKPELRMSFSENSQPYGPSATLKDMRIDNTTTNQRLEAAYRDTDMNAKDAIIELYNKEVFVSKIQKALSAGVLGVGKKRRFVPTRWSITAVDDTLSKDKLKEVKQYAQIDSIRVYQNVALDNRWLVIMIPGAWEYELVEAWYPGTTWNMDNRNIEIFSSYEGFTGRKTYAEIGGCYYAARLATTELLDRIKAQAKVVILREAHSGYIMPVGVWNVREHVREALRSEPLYFADRKELFDFIPKKMEIRLPTWIANSSLLRNDIKQRRLSSG